MYDLFNNTFKVGHVRAHFKGIFAQNLNILKFCGFDRGVTVGLGGKVIIPNIAE